MGEIITDIAGLAKVAKEWCGYRRTRNLQIGSAEITVSKEGLGGAPAISMIGEKNNFENYRYIGIIKHLEGINAIQNAKDILEVYKGDKQLAQLGKASILLITIVEISEMIRGSSASDEFQRVIKRIADDEITWNQGFSFPYADFVWANSALFGWQKTLELAGKQNVEYVVKGKGEKPNTVEDKKEAKRRMELLKKKQKKHLESMESLRKRVSEGGLRPTKQRLSLMEKCKLNVLDIKEVNRKSLQIMRDKIKAKKLKELRGEDDDEEN